MSRSGYVDDFEGVGLWRGSVARALHGKRGQALLREMAAALDAMQNKRLITGHLVDGAEVCALGAVAVARGLDVSRLDPEDFWRVAETFGCARAMAQEIAYINDEHWRPETPEQRWTRVRHWVDVQLAEVGGAPLESSSAPTRPRNDLGSAPDEAQPKDGE